MAAFMLARVSAQRAGQTLFYAQAVDQALTVIQRASTEEFYEEVLKIPSLSSTKRLPAVVLWHHGMRMKFSTTLQQPFAVQDVECTVVGFEPADNDYDTMTSTGHDNVVGLKLNFYYLGIMSGYFACDLILELVNFNSVGMIIHHVITLFACVHNMKHEVFAFQIIWLTLCECSTPFTNIR